MARVKRGVTTNRRHKKVISRAEGYWGRKKNVFRRAHEQLMKSGQYAYRDRRNRKRDMRRLWIARISAACKLNEMKYSDFIHALIEHGIALDRKILSDIAIHDADAFRAVVDSVRQA
jgi:large subunit ribosomal protein L20